MKKPKRYFSVGLDMLVNPPNDGHRVDENRRIDEQQKRIEELEQVVKVVCWCLQSQLNKESS